MSEEDYSIEEKLEETMADLKEANDEIVWWHNRFKAVQRDYEELKTKIDKAIEYIKNNYDEENDYSIPKKRLLQILGDKDVKN